MKKKLISLLLLAAVVMTMVPQAVSAATHYSKLYYDFIVQDHNDSYNPNHNWASYRLLDLDGDHSPELWIDYGIYAAGCKLATVYNGKVYSYPLEYGILHYIEGQNVFANHYGHQGMYGVTVYKLDKGQLITLASGSCDSNTESYEWNGSPVSSSVYSRKLKEYIDPNTCKSSFDEDLTQFNYNEILSYMDVLYANNANTFTDVSPDCFYYDPVLWAVNNGITNGTTPETFSPDANCTRGQIVTFLWRTMGEPEPFGSENPFADVMPGSYYYKAILWAVEQGITKGMTATTFSPDIPCSRGQAVTFLWRAKGQPHASGYGAGAFTDVKADTFYFDAVRWAVQNSITNGTDATHFSPDRNCTRGQIVTFLYRTMNR